MAGCGLMTVAVGSQLGYPRLGEPAGMQPSGGGRRVIVGDAGGERDRGSGMAGPYPRCSWVPHSSAWRSPPSTYEARLADLNARLA